jgi:hypothetical protein
MFTRLTKIYHEFPRKFWIVVLVSFIDRIGETLLFPFFTLNIPSHLRIGSQKRFASMYKPDPPAESTV